MINSFILCGLNQAKFMVPGGHLMGSAFTYSLGRPPRLNRLNPQFCSRQPPGAPWRRGAETIPGWAGPLFQLPTPAEFDAIDTQAPKGAPLHA